MSKFASATVLLTLLAGTTITEAKTVDPARIVTSHGKEILSDQKGRTLYTFDKDKAGKSNCTLLCAAAWPPFIAAGGEKAAGKWSFVKRANGSLQWAHDGHPLYTYRLDLKPGDISGDGVDGEWHVARP